MHCPRCGQEQASSVIKFCSRCGFPLDVVAEVLTHGGTIPELEALGQTKGTLLTRRNGVIFSVMWFLFFLFIMTPIGGIANIDELAAVSAILGIFGGLMLLIASLLLLEKPKEVPKYLMSTHGLRAHKENLESGMNRPALPEQRSRPANDYAAPMGSWRAPDTGEFSAPGSVTDNTTKLLSKEEEQ